MAIYSLIVINSLIYGAWAGLLCRTMHGTGRSPRRRPNGCTAPCATATDGTRHSPDSRPAHCADARALADLLRGGARHVLARERTACLDVLLDLIRAGLLQLSIRIEDRALRPCAADSRQHDS